MSEPDRPVPMRTLAAFLEGEVTRSEALEIEASLRDCATTRRRLEGIDGLRQALSELPHGVDGLDLVPAIRLAIVNARAAHSPRLPRRIARPCAGLLAFAVVLALVMWSRGRTSSNPVISGFHPVMTDSIKSNLGATDASGTLDRWVGIDVSIIDVRGNSRPSSAGGTVRSEEGLVFRYTNLGHEPFGYLMVFAIDAAHEVHWYYPAYEVAGGDPSSLPISPGVTAMALPDAIYHDLPPGPLTIYGVFSREPLHVLEIEHRVATMIARDGLDPIAPPRAPVASSGQRILSLSVMR
jgi:hypothetical protein